MTSFEVLRRTLRQQLRQQRRDLSRPLRQQAQRRLAQRLSRLPQRPVGRFAGYCAQDGEIDPHPWLQNQPRCYPVLTRLSPTGVRFHLVTRHTRWQPGPWGIRQPQRTRPVAAWTLKALLIPLVAFRPDGQRLGRGGGFYDRVLADFARRPRRPHVLGVAFDFQCVETFPVAAWDQPLDRVITDQRQIDVRGVRNDITGQP